MRFGSELTTEATWSPDARTVRISRTTAIPAVLWTDWMKSSTGGDMRCDNENITRSIYRKICLLRVSFLTISQDVDVAAQKTNQCVLQLPGILISLQNSTKKVLRPLKDQHGGLHCSKARVHQLRLGNVTTCKTPDKPAGVNRDPKIKDKTPGILCQMTQL